MGQWDITHPLHRTPPVFIQPHITASSGFSSVILLQSSQAIFDGSRMSSETNTN